MIKNTVLLYGLKPEILLADNIIRGIYTKYGYQCIITSGFDSHEGLISFHNIGLALDYRTKFVDYATLNKMIEELKSALPQYDLGLHSKDTPNEHLHVEFDPKNDPLFVAHKAVWKETGEWPE
jgi:hypothetical protein